MEVEFNGEIIKNIDTIKQKDSISVEGLFFTGTQSVKYTFYASDHYGNDTTKEVVINIEIPEITITNIEKNTENLASITAELSQDIDEGTVSFQKNRHGHRTTLVATDQGKKIENYNLRARLNMIKGQYYDINDRIALFSKTDETIAEIDPNT